MKILKWLDAHLEEVVIFVTLSAMSIIIALQVLMRYGFQSSLSWSEEVARYLFIWLIYIGISYGVKMNAHVAVTATDLILPAGGRRAMKIISAIVFLIFSATIVYYGWQVCSKIMRLGQEAPATSLDMWVVYLAVPTGFTLTCFRLVQRLYLLFKNPELD
jgi:TRAP-type C4-dicarboxylate transport system, small permease component